MSTKKYYPVFFSCKGDHTVRKFRLSVFGDVETVR